MKIGRTGSEVVSGGATNAPKKFKIANSDLMFTILSSKIYNNKPLAVIRELCCNAYDAHVAAGKKDVPFELHLPTNFEPWFAVKDFGTGLSAKQIENLYCTYGESTKSRSNDFIGAMGIGSKSPFCYTEGFMVTSRFDGKVYTYSAYIEKDGTPSVKRLSTENMKEGEVNGLEVNFPVKPQDCWEFENMAKVALEFFDPMPTVNINNFKPVKQEYAVRTEHWGMRSSVGTHHGTGIRAIQGMVQYGVGNIDISRLSTEQRKLSEKPLDIFFPIGSLSVAASREMLSNDEDTIEAILTELTQIWSRMMDEIVEKIDACKTEWEARLMIFAMENASSMSGIMAAAESEGRIYRQYKHFTLAKEKPFVNELDFHDTMLARFKRNSNTKVYASKRSLFTKRDATVRANVEFEAMKSAENMAEYDVTFKIEPNTLFIVNDLKFGGEKYLHYFLQQDTANTHASEPVRRVYLMSRYDSKSDPISFKEEVTKILAAVGNPPVMNLSELKAKYPQLDERAPGAGPSVSVRRDALVFEGNGYTSSDYSNGWFKSWKKLLAKDVPTGKKYYVTVENFTKLAPVCGTWSSARGFYKFFNAVRQTGDFGLTPDTPIYGLRKEDVKKIDKNEWVELTSYVSSKLPKVATKERQFAMSQAINGFNCDHGDFLGYLVKKVSTLDPASPLTEFVRLFMATDRKSGERNTHLLELIQQAKLPTPHAVRLTDVWGILVTEHYPILSLDFNRYDNNDRRMNEKLLSYVKQTDEMAKIAAAKIAAVIPEEVTADQETANV